MINYRFIYRNTTFLNISNYKRVVQGRWGRICEIIRLYIEQIMTKSDTAIRSLEFESRHIEKYIDEKEGKLEKNSKELNVTSRKF